MAHCSLPDINIDWYAKQGIRVIQTYLNKRKMYALTFQNEGHRIEIPYTPTVRKQLQFFRKEGVSTKDALIMIKRIK